MPIKTKIAPVLEKVIAKQILESMQKKTFKRYQIVVEKPELILSSLNVTLSEFANCFFFQSDEGEKTIISLVHVADAFDWVKDAALNYNIISFIYAKGAITISFDRSRDELRDELYLSCWGSIIPYADNLAAKHGGVIY